MFYKKIRQEVLCLVNVQAWRKGVPPPANAEASLPPMGPTTGQSSIEYFPGHGEGSLRGSKDRKAKREEK